MGGQTLAILSGMTQIASSPLLAPSERRFAALALTAVVHLLLIAGWQATRRPPLPPAGADGPRIQWIALKPPALPPPRALPRAQAQASARVAPPPAAAAPSARPVPARPSAPGVNLAPNPAPPSSPAMPATAPLASDTTSLTQRARRAAGDVDRALRKENTPYIVAPPDSPEIRMRKGMEQAADMAPNRWYEAPKTEEMANYNGDGARRTRVRSGDSTYCITERAPTSSIDTVETVGKLRITTCPQHETTATRQEWRTARDAGLP